MTRRHVTVVSLFLALALALGAAAVLRTVTLGASPAAAAPAGELAARNAQLDRYEAQLRRAVRTRPPARTAVARGAAAPERVVYVRPAPKVEPDHHDHEGDGRESDRDRHDDD